MKQRLNELLALARQDRKKTVTLSVLVLVALVMGVRALVSGMGGPSTASAASPTDKASAKPVATVLISVEDALASLRTQEPISDGLAPDRDLFQSDWVVMGPDTVLTPGKSGPPQADNADDPNDADVRRRTIEEEASALRLRSTLLGANPVAVIERPGANGAQPHVAVVGGVIDGFRVVAIEAHTVELEKEGVRIVLEQAKQTP